MTAQATVVALCVLAVAAGAAALGVQAVSQDTATAAAQVWSELEQSGIPTHRIGAVTDAVVTAVSRNREEDPDAGTSLISEAESVSVNTAEKAEEQATLAAVLAKPEVQEALNAKTPDAVDRLIQGILEGTGKGGVVTQEFNRNGVHATIISNVNELRVQQLNSPTGALPSNAPVAPDVPVSSV